MKPRLLAAILTVVILAVVVLRRHHAPLHGAGADKSSASSTEGTVAGPSPSEVAESGRKAALAALPTLLKDGGWPGAQANGAADAVLRALPNGSEAEFNDLRSALAGAPGVDPEPRCEALAAVEEFHLLSQPSSASAAPEALAPIATAMNQWAAADPESAEHWLSAERGGPVRDAAVAAFIAQTAANRDAADRNRLMARLKKGADE